MASQHSPNIREVYQAYVKLSHVEAALAPGVIAGVIAEQRGLPLLLCVGVHGAENTVQKGFSRSVLDLFDVYFKFGSLDETDNNAIAHFKRVSTLPPQHLETCFDYATMGPGHLKSKIADHILEATYKMPAPLLVGQNGMNYFQMLVVAKGTCSWCKSIKSDSTMKCLCGCSYCSKRCQKQHWRLHKSLEH